MREKNLGGTSRRRFLAVTAGAASAAGMLPVAAPAAAAAPAVAPAIPAESRAERAATPGPLGATAAARLDAAIDAAMNNLAGEGFSDLLRDQFETVLLKSGALRDRLHAQVRARLEDWRVDDATVAPVELVSLPKRTPYGVRRAALLRPSDAILYLALAILAAPEIEAGKLAKADRQVFSYRYAPHGESLFDREVTYAGFVACERERLLDNRAGVAVFADIEAFYERIAPERLRAGLEACGVDPAVAERVADLLEFWQGRGGVGLPIGPNASRILAEAVLQPIDRRLAAAGIPFLRYADDYRVFAPNVETAQAHLSVLAQAVERAGFTLNERKTKLAAAADILAAKRSGRMLLAQQNPPSDTPRSSDDPSDALMQYGESNQQFRAAPAERLAVLRQTDLGFLRAALLDGAQVNPLERARLYIEAALAQRNGEAIGLFPQVVARYPQLSGYCASALDALASQIDPALRDRLAGQFAGLVEAQPTPRDHIRMAALRLLGSAGFARPQIVAAFVRGLGEGRTSYLARVAMESLRKTAPESVLAEMIGSYGSFGEWAQRAILAWAIERGREDALREPVRASADPFAQALLDRLATV
jgi:hypothetical protein